MNTVTLPTTPEQRQAFTALGLTLWKENVGKEERWDIDDSSCLWLVNGQEPTFWHPTATPMLSARVLQILGLLPPPLGMVLIPAKEIHRLLSWLDAAKNTNWYNEPATTRRQIGIVIESLQETLKPSQAPANVAAKED